MSTTITDTAAPSWRIKKLTQSGKVYVQACIQPDRSSPLYTVGLGYVGADGMLTYEGVQATPEAVLEALRVGGLRLLRLQGSTPKTGPGDAQDMPLTGDALKAEIRRFAVGGAAAGVSMAGIVAPAPDDYKNMTLADFVGDPKKDKSKVSGPFSSWRVTEISDVSWQSERYVLGRLVKSPLGKVKMKDLSGPRWQAYVTSPEMVKLAPRSRKLVEQAYRAVLNYGAFLGACTRQERFLNIKGSSKRAPNRPVTPLTPDEVYALVNATTTPMHKALFGVGFGEGLRPAELLRMDWSDVVWDRKILRVRGTKTEKSGDPIPLTDFASAYLREWAERCGNPTHGPVWTYHGKPITSIKKSFRDAGERAGLREAGRRVHPYVMRHSFATLAASSGMPITTAQSVLRHSDVSMLWGVYVSWGAVAEAAPGIEKLPLSKADADAAGLIQRRG